MPMTDELRVGGISEHRKKKSQFDECWIMLNLFQNGVGVTKRKHIEIKIYLNI